MAYAVLAFLLLLLVPSLKLALHSLAQVSWNWVVGAMGLEVVSELCLPRDHRPGEGAGA